MSGIAIVPADQAAARARPAPRRASFVAARRHSRLVRFLKRAIPVGSGAAVIIVAGIGIFDPFRSIGAISIGPVSLSGTRVTMDQPRLTGFRASDAKPYEVTAESATQDVRKPTLVELTKLTARVEMGTSETVRLAADTGLYDTQKEQIDLRTNVRVTSSGGYSAFLKSAFVDFKAGSVTSTEPVKVEFTNGVIEAQTLNVTDGGNRLTFEGRVQAVFDMPAPAAGSGPTAQDTNPPLAGARP